MTAAQPFRIEDAVDPALIETVGRIFHEHLPLLDLDPTFLGVTREFADLRSQYIAPAGAMLMALDADGSPLGVAAMRPLPGPGDCDTSMIFVLPAARGRGIGTALGRALVSRAQAIGYRRMHAIAKEGSVAATLLMQAGFSPSAPYFPNPGPGTAHLSYELPPVDAG